MLGLMFRPGHAQEVSGPWPYGSAGPPGTVSATGSETIVKQPQRLRLRIELLAKGSDLEDALAALAARKQAARAQLIGLGALKDSIRIGPPRIVTKRTSQQQRLEMMLARRLLGTGRKRAAGKKAAPVKLAAWLTAEWELKADSPEQLLRTAYPIQQKVREADLAGAKEASKLSPEEEEILEEAEQSESFSFAAGEEYKPGEPLFFFVSPISQQERNRAMAQAFQKAKRQAEALAQAVGAKLGPIRSVSAQTQSGSEEEDYSTFFGLPYQVIRQFRSGQPTEAGKSLEAVGTQLGPVRFTVIVTAAFQLQAKQQQSPAGTAGGQKATGTER